MKYYLIVAGSFIVCACSDPGLNGNTTDLNYGASEAQRSQLDSLLTTVNSDAGESWLTLYPDGRTAVFGRHVDGFGDQRIYLTTWDGATWSTPQLASFAADLSERGARFSPDGESVYFASTRPTSAGGPNNDWNIWSVTFNGADSWGEPSPLIDINSSESDFHPSAAANGSVYFGSRRKESVGESDMFVAKPGSLGWTIEPVSILNTQYSEPDPFIAPNGDYIIFARTDAPGGFGGDDLYISYANKGGWTDPRNLGSKVNTEEYEYGAFVTADGKTLVFTTWASGNAQIATVEMDALNLD